MENKDMFGKPFTPTVGFKADGEKTRWDLVPWECLQDIADILTTGAKKYSDYNWQRLERANDRCFAAMMRHLSKWRLGERIDKESGKSHLAHAAVNAIFLLWFDKHPSPEYKQHCHDADNATEPN